MSDERAQVVDEEVDNVDAYKRELELGDEIREEARLRDYALKERVAARYNKKVMRITFLKNDLVLFRNDIGISKHGEGKLAANWKDLFRIAEVLGKSYYKIAILQGADLARSWHACDLKKSGKVTRNQHVDTEETTNSLRQPTCGWLTSDV
ncbi:hypothetical protein PIB30_056328 [Stylosanthes scabra]|uniref:Uncharacterized protein n=1 Tax=Stylosanthes scabra TaxID=79078 RepID=A0ABU6UIU6_9FABA|nr:hypothetical protein [Stylosanthes scabra]